MRISITFLLLPCLTFAIDPCTQLCNLDGKQICTKGSWTEKGNCRHYFFVGLPSQGNYCYHTTETTSNCPASGTPVRPTDASSLVLRGGRGPQVATTVRPTTTARPTTVSPTTTSLGPRPGKHGAVVAPGHLHHSSSSAGFESIFVQPTSGKHRSTVFLLHGKGGEPEHMITLGRNSWMRSMPDTKFVSIKALGRLWFAYRGVTADRGSLDMNMQRLISMIDFEASLIAGGHSKIFLVGYSQGGMLSVWAGLMGGRELGGVAMMNSAVPVMDIGSISAEGRNVPIVHFHGLQDNTVPIFAARMGRDNAVAAGARSYSLIERPGSHDVSSGVASAVTEWLNSRL